MPCFDISECVREFMICNYVYFFIQLTADYLTNPNMAENMIRYIRGRNFP